MDLTEAMKESKKDVIVILKVWKEMFSTSLSGEIQLAFTKGSAIKSWDSPIDYVPNISDIDIHVLLKNKNQLFPQTKEGFMQALAFNEEVENLFLRKRPEYFHLPRCQVIIINDFLNDPNFFTTPVEQKNILYGEKIEFVQSTKEKIKNHDLTSLLELQEVLSALPNTCLDRLGLDWWTIIRRLSWRVSPSVVRVLSILQEERDHVDVWSLNRTNICSKLEKIGLVELSSNYKSYYYGGWELFFSKMADIKLFRKVVHLAYLILYESLQIAQNHSKKMG